jgi:4a-hydroxytetrahydrobiopterin dehydratase
LGCELRKVSADWRIINAHHLERVFSFPDFGKALSFTNQVGEVAEELDHHPDLRLSWGKLVVQIWTHKVDGLTKSDFELAGVSMR